MSQKRSSVTYFRQSVRFVDGRFISEDERLGTRQGDPISAYLFILVLEIVFNFIKQNKDIHDLTFFDHTSLYTAYADDTTFLLKEKVSAKKIMNVYDTFSIDSGLKPGKSKSKIAGIGVSMERSVNGTLWNGIINLTNKFSENLSYSFFL